jgi:uncharacterized membrane protein YkvA (DUF1232 family)
MLFKMLNDVNEKIDKINPFTEANNFAMQLRKMRPNLKDELISQGMKQSEADNFILGMSNIQLLLIKGIPPISNEMKNMLQEGSGEPAFRCVVASSLAYFVQPHDLIPDDLPGGYGFIDDAIILYEAAALSFEILGEIERAEEERKKFQYSFNLIPDTYCSQFQDAVNNMAATLNMMRSLDPSIAEMTTQMLINDPLQPIVPQGGIGASPAMSGFGAQFINYSNTNKLQYTWKDGNNMGVNFPEGGGVATDGKDIFVF